jgi:hypothetical protein
MDYELDILHELMSDLYNIELCKDKIQDTLGEIERKVSSKPDVRESVG